MATYYVDNVGGNDANSGLSEALAKQTIESLRTITAAGDIIRLKYTATDYTLSVASASTAFTSVLITGYVSNTSSPTLSISRGTGSVANVLCAGVMSFTNINLLFAFSSASRVSDILGNTCDFFIRNCYVTCSNTSANSVLRPFPTARELSFENSTLNGDQGAGQPYYFQFSSTTGGFRIINNKMFNLRLKSVQPLCSFTNASGSTFAYNSVRVLHVDGTGAINRIVDIGAKVANIYKNSLYISHTVASLASTFCQFSGASNQFFGQVFDNIVYFADTISTNNVLYATSSAVTVSSDAALSLGNNRVINLTNTSYNITGLTETYGASATLAANPFVNVTPFDPDYFKLDPGSAGYAACIDEGYFDPYSNIGSDGKDSGGGGATLNAYDLRAGVVVGGVTGTLIIPDPSKVLLGEVYDATPNQKIGISVGADFNDNIAEDKVQFDFNYKNLNINKKGKLSVGAADYPAENKVLYPTTFAFGTKKGTLGQYNTSLLNISEQINNNAKSIISNVLTSEFAELKYLKEVERNDFYSNTKQFGIRPLTLDMTKDVIGQDTNDLQFEIKLTTDFDNRDGDDYERVAELYLMEKMEAIRRQLRATKFGNFNNIRVLKEFSVQEAEKIQDRIILLRAVATVSYKV